MKMFALISEGKSRPLSVEDHHKAIAKFQLGKNVPAAIHLHFETAKNLYLYAWFVYRFHAIAEQQALTSLEFALRERISELHLASKEKVDKMGLAELLKRARNNHLITNDALRNKNLWASEIAKQRHAFSAIEEMRRLGTSVIQIDDSDITPTNDDLAHDWISNFIDCLPRIRNDYAHGSETLRHTVLRSFDIASDLIDQLYRPDPKANAS